MLHYLEIPKKIRIVDSQNQSGNGNFLLYDLGVSGQSEL